MRTLIRAALAAAVLAAAAIPASALTVRDVCELARAGLGEDTLLALVEIEPAVITVTGDDLRAMKAAGVSERVMIAMLRHGRTEPLPSEVRDDRDLQRDIAVLSALPPSPPPQVIVVERREPRPEPQIVQVPVFVPIAVPRRARDGRDDEAAQQDDRSGTEPGRTKAEEPVFWGWGGKQRPDSWKLHK